MYPVKTPRFEIVRKELPHMGFLHLDSPQPDLSQLEPIDDTGLSTLYASESLIRELEVIRSLGGIADSYYFHATSSAALPGIEKHKAILSSKELITRGEPIVTGEVTTDMGEYHRITGGHDEVYVSHDTSRTTYSVTTGNHYPIIFGLSRLALAHKPSYLLCEYGDGIQGGKEISLGHVTSLITPYEKVPEIKEWAADNCNSATLTVSLDAAEAMRYIKYR